MYNSMLATCRKEMQKLSTIRNMW